jgi:hypothetical protein
VSLSPLCGFRVINPFRNDHELRCLPSHGRIPGSAGLTRERLEHP